MPLLISIHQSEPLAGKRLLHLLHQFAGMIISCREIFELNSFVEYGVITPFEMEVVALHDTGLR